jgi:hypothetical protein
LEAFQAAPVVLPAFQEEPVLGDQDQEVLLALEAFQEVPVVLLALEAFQEVQEVLPALAA